MSTPLQDDPEEVAEQLHSSAIRLLRSLRHADESSGLTASRLSALSVIVLSGQITLGDLAQAEQVRPPTMTRIVHALQQQKLVMKIADPNDGRLIRIAATTKGKRELLRGRARRVQQLAGAIRGLSARERKNLRAALKTIQQLGDQTGRDLA